MDKEQLIAQIGEIEEFFGQNFDSFHAWTFTPEKRIELVEAIRQAISRLKESEVPEEPTEEQWGGLARDIMMWLDMYIGSNKTPRALFKYLEMCGREIPQWLRDEPEMQNLDHVPSKGTRVTIIYKAMLSTRPK